MDFFNIKERSTKNGVVEVFPDFRVGRSKDLMIKGKHFDAIWDEKKGLWSTDEYDVQRLVDEKLWEHRNKVAERNEGSVHIKLMSDFSSNSWKDFRSYLSNMSDSSHPLDSNLTFANTEVKKSDYVTRRLPYPLCAGDISAYEEIITTLYSPEERAKIEWAIGAIVSGDSKKIQKFLVLYGAPGTGKGTIMDIVMKLFGGYYTTFEAKGLTSGNQFATEAFKGNPLVAIDPDGDLSGIQDNTRLNSIVAHEPMTINEKFKPSYMAIIWAFLFLSTNKPVKITDAQSGLIRRMIDVRPSGVLLSPRRYQTLMSQIEFELGAIAYHCLEVYRSMGKNYYSGYRPIEMMLQTDVFFNFIEANYDIFREQDGVSLQQAYELYREYCDESGIRFEMPKFKLRTELQSYFKDFEERALVEGTRIRSYFSGFKADRFKVQVNDENTTAPVFSLVMDETTSIIDKEFSAMPAQYANAQENPLLYWTNEPRHKDGKEFIPKPEQVCSTTLGDIDTSKLHYVKPPLNHIVIDFDLQDANGNKSLERNLEAASKWPPTYAEHSKSGSGVHLHYNYEGDPAELSRIYEDGIEIKVFTGNSSLRRRLSKCNNVPVANISTGLPIKERKVINQDAVKSERSLRELIARNLRKEIHPGTKPSMDFIHKILDDAFHQGLEYDLTDLRPKILAFGNNSSNQALYCIKLVQDMKFKGAEVNSNPVVPEKIDDQRAVLYDVEVFPNLFVICWKYEGSDNVVKMINPTPQKVEELMNMKLVGFNVRKYDNHILWGRFMGMDNAQLYQLSKRIVSNVKGATFGQAYGVSYADIYDYSSKKQSLKKWQIELGLNHDELGMDWDQPVPEHLWDRVAEYCANDVVTMEQIMEHLHQDFVARQILADLSGLTVNDTTQKHTAAIIFEGDKEAQKQFNYTDLSEEFPGYKFAYNPETKTVESTYRGEVVGEGGRVRANPGMHTDVALLDVASMHPTSIHELDLFGRYTKNFWALVQARLAIKHGDYESAAKMLGGKLAPYLNDPADAEALSHALKIVVNIVYGLTSAKFDNPFRDLRNVDNIVAKRGALFMMDLEQEVEDRGFTVAHVKTDSIKIPNATPEIIQFVMDFGKKYGYTFEHEATYSKMCLVNDAVYIAKVGWAQKAKKIGTWEAVGTQFKHPYVFKTLFSHEPIQFEDRCETKAVTSALYLDMGADAPMAMNDGDERDLHFIGKVGQFCPIKPGHGGGLLLREKNGKYDAAAGTKGFFWLEAGMVKTLEKEGDIDRDYHETLVNEALDKMEKFGDVEWFLDDSAKLVAA